MITNPETPQQVAESIANYQGLSSQAAKEIAVRLESFAKQEYGRGLHENCIKMDKWFAEEVAKGTDEASKMMKDELMRQGAERACEDLLKVADAGELEDLRREVQRYKENLK